MYYQLNASQENQLLNEPETGMGYQIIEASKAGEYLREKFIVLNTQAVIEIDGYEAIYIRSIISEGIHRFKMKADVVTLNSIKVLTEIQFRGIKVSEPKATKESGATENAVENANGIELFVRLSAFEDDKRVDKINKCLRAGSFTTTIDDYATCKKINDDPIERYALPNNDTIKFAFYILPKKTDTLQRGIVQPAYNKRGGGKEVYFANGTSKETYIKQTPF